jgi:hypothetical protein
MKILHLPTSVGGNAYGLSRGERALGHSSEVLVAQGSCFNYPADHLLFSSPPKHRLLGWLRHTKLLKTFLAVRKAYDVFHFNFGQSLLHSRLMGLPLFELPYYPRGAKLIMSFNGCDARQKYPSMERNPFSPCHDQECYDGYCVSGMADSFRQKLIARADQYAHAIFALNPDLLHFLPERARFLPYAIAGWNEIQTQPWKGGGSRIRIAHAPTNRAAKGSAAVFAAMVALQKEYGDRVEFMLIEGVSNKEALRLYASADLVIDQLRIGWYGGLAVEAMKMGRPVAVYIREEDLACIPPAMARQLGEAVINVTEASLLESLRTIVENPHILKNIAEAGTEYVLSWHDPVAVARVAIDTYTA